jgi:hypothetical protein
MPNTGLHVKEYMDEKGKTNKTRGVSHHDGLAIYIKKCLKAKENLWKFKYFTMQKYNLQKKSSKRNPKSFNIS